MSADVAALEQRIIELESRLAFQEHALAELNDALSASRLQTERHAQALRRVIEELKQPRGGLMHDDPADEPPPPHY